LSVGPAMAVAFGLINVAAVARGVLPAFHPQSFSQSIAASGALWIASFLIFIVIYAPILTRPRIDGRPG